MGETNALRFTNNFSEVGLEEKQFSIVAFNEWRKECTKQNIPVMYDRRNAIYAAGPSMNFTMYYNYLHFLSTKRTKWTEFGHFDLGYLPYIMLPSFMTNSKMEGDLQSYLRMCNVSSIPHYKGCRLLGIRGGFCKDFWITRQDMLKIARHTEEALGVTFSMQTPEEASILEYTRVVAKYEEEQNAINRIQQTANEEQE